MPIDDDRVGEAETLLRVEIPERMHVRLHTAKVQTGKTISDLVTEALEAYVEEGT